MADNEGSGGSMCFGVLFGVFREMGDSVWVDEWGWGPLGCRGAHNGWMMGWGLALGIAEGGAGFTEIVAGTLALAVGTAGVVGRTAVGGAGLAGVIIGTGGVAMTGVVGGVTEVLLGLAGIVVGLAVVVACLPFVVLGLLLVVACLPHVIVALGGEGGAEHEECGEGQRA